MATDNDFGPKTEQSVKNVQHFLGLNQTGVYDPVLIDAGFLYPIHFTSDNSFSGFCQDRNGNVISVG